MHWLPRSVGRKRAGTFKHAGTFSHGPVSDHELRLSCIQISKCSYLGVPYSHDMCPCLYCFPGRERCLPDPVTGMARVIRDQ